MSIYELANNVVKSAITKQIQISTAESCTGGMIGSALTEISGSSAVYQGGFITYSNEAKRDFLGVNWHDLETLGAVSTSVAKQMAAGVLERNEKRAQISVAVTGIAGPTGGTAKKPVGLVYIGLARHAGDRVSSYSEKHIFPGPSREDIRRQATEQALSYLLEMIEQA